MHIQEDQQMELRIRLCEGASNLTRVSAVLAAVAMILHIVSVSSPYWMAGKIRGDYSVAHTGLWKDCQRLNLFTFGEQWGCMSYEASHHIDTLPGFMKASQTLALLGVCGQALSSVLLLVVTLLPKLTARRLWLFVSLGANTASGLLVLIAMIVYPVYYPDRPLPPFEVTWSVSWCFGVDFLSVLASTSVTVILFIDFKSRTSAYTTSVA